MINKLQTPRKNQTYSFFLKNGDIEKCIYDGTVGNSHCFTTKKTDDYYEYHFLNQKDFRINGSNIEVLIDQPETITISRNKESIEFSQIENAWSKANEEND